MELKFKGNKKNRSRDVMVGVLYVILGMIIPILTLIFALAMAGAEYFRAAEFGQFIGAGFLLGVIVIVSGLKIITLPAAYKKIERALKKPPNYSLPTLMDAAHRPLEPFSRTLCAMCKRGYFGDVVLNLNEKELIVDKDAPPPTARREDRPTIYVLHRKLPLVQVLTAISTMLVVITFLPGNSAALPAGIVAGALSLFLSLYYIPAPMFFREVPRPMPKFKAPGKTGNPELDDLLKEMSEYQKELLRLNHVINHHKINPPLENSMKILDDMISYLGENPHKIKQLRQFTGYYLPTTVKLLQNYEELSLKENKGENISAAMMKIEGMTDKVAEVFKHEYDELFMDKAMDISAEVDVMKLMIEQSEAINPFEK